MTKMKRKIVVDISEWDSGMKKPCVKQNDNSPQLSQTTQINQTTLPAPLVKPMSTDMKN